MANLDYNADQNQNISNSFLNDQLKQNGFKGT